MSERFKSAGFLLWGVVKRIYVWAPALLLDPFNWYQNLLRPHLPGWAPAGISVPAEWSLGIFWVLLLASFCGAYHELRMRFISTRPNLEFLRLKTEKIPIFRRDTCEGEPVFSRLGFRNLPIDISDASLADRVVAEMQFFQEDGTTPLFEHPIIGNWADAPSPSDTGSFVHHYIPVDIEPNGLPRWLNVLLKYDNEEFCYVHNNEGLGEWGWKYEPYRIGKGSFRLQVSLKGNRMSKPRIFRFGFLNSGIGKPITIIPLKDF